MFVAADFETGKHQCPSTGKRVYLRGSRTQQGAGQRQEVLSCQLRRHRNAKAFCAVKEAIQMVTRCMSPFIPCSGKGKDGEDRNRSVVARGGQAGLRCRRTRVVYVETAPGQEGHAPLAPWCGSTVASFQCYYYGQRVRGESNSRGET